MKRVLVGDTEDIRSSRDGSGGLGTDMLERARRGAVPLPVSVTSCQGHLKGRASPHTLTSSTMVCILPPLFLLSLLIQCHQDPSLRLVPAKAPVKASVSDTANSLGLHDTLKYGPRTLAEEIKSTNPLQARLENVRHSMPCTTTSAEEGTCYHSGMRHRGPSS